MSSDFKITTKCYLCGEEELQVISDEHKNTMMQCISCGFSTSTALQGNIDENENYKKTIK